MFADDVVRPVHFPCRGRSVGHQRVPCNLRQGIWIESELLNSSYLYQYKKHQFIKHLSQLTLRSIHPTVYIKSWINLCN